jgi:hypothetical protein
MFCKKRATAVFVLKALLIFFLFNAQANTHNIG